MNRITRPICHGRMCKGNNRCNRVIARVLAESLLGAVKSKSNRDVTSGATVIGIVASTVSVQKTPDKFAKKKKKKREREKKEEEKSREWQPAYGHTSTSQLRISVLASTGGVQVTKKCHKSTEAKITVPTTNR